MYRPILYYLVVYSICVMCIETSLTLGKLAASLRHLCKGGVKYVDIIIIIIIYIYIYMYTYIYGSNSEK
jgi:hypothetical protein